MGDLRLDSMDGSGPTNGAKSIEPIDSEAALVARSERLVERSEKLLVDIKEEGTSNAELAAELRRLADQLKPKPLWRRVGAVLLSNLLLAGLVAGAVYWGEQQREEERALRAERLENLRFVRGVRGHEGNFQRIDLAGMSLAGLNLSGVNLAGANLERTSFGGEGGACAKANGGFEFRRAEGSLESAVLDGASLRFANLESATLANASLRRADLDGALLAASDMSGADFSFASLAEADLSFVDFSDAQLGFADLSGANISGARFVGAELEGFYGSRAFWVGPADLTGVWWDHRFPPEWPLDFSPPSNPLVVRGWRFCS